MVGSTGVTLQLFDLYDLSLDFEIEERRLPPAILDPLAGGFRCRTLDDVEFTR